jgi:hypothetical protein
VIQDLAPVCYLVTQCFALRIVCGQLARPIDEFLVAARHELRQADAPHETAGQTAAHEIALSREYR